MSPLFERLREALGIRPAEVERTTAMFIWGGTCALASLLVEASGTGLFLARCSELQLFGVRGIGLLPLIWAVSGIAAVPLASLLRQRIATWLDARQGPRTDRMVVPSTLALIVGLIGFRLAFLLDREGAAEAVLFVYPVFLVAAQIFFTMIALNTEVPANQLFNVREARRVFGIIGAGTILGDVVGGFAMPVFLATIGTSADLLLVAAAILAVGAWHFTRISRRYRAAFTGSSSEPAPESRPEVTTPDDPAPFVPWRHGYVLLIAAFVILAQLGNYIVDFQLMSAAEERFAGQEDAITSFLGYLFGGLGIFKLFGQLFLTNRIFARVGLFPALMALPAGLLAISLAIIAFPRHLFVAFTVQKSWDDSLRYTLHQAGSPLLFQALPPRPCAQAQEFVTGIVDAVAAGASGLLLFIVCQTLVGPDEIERLAIGVALCSVASLVLVWRLRARYLATLLSYLSEGRAPVTSFDLGAGPLRRELLERLNSGDPQVIVPTLEIIETHGAPEFTSSLPCEALFDLHHEAIDLAVLRIVGRHANLPPELATRLLPRVRALAATGPAMVRAAAVECLCALQREAAVEEVSALMEDPLPEVRAAAVLGLVTYGGIEGILAAGTTLSTLMQSRAVEDRRFVARLIGTARLTSAGRPLGKLMEDSHASIRRMAFQSAGIVGEERLYPALVKGLGDYRTRAAAQEALAEHIGDAAVPLLAQTMEDRTQPQGLRIAAAATIGRIESAAAREALARAADIEDEHVRTTVLAALGEAARVSGPPPRERIAPLVDAELDAFFENLRAKSELAGVDEILVRALEARSEDQRSRIMCLLGLIHQPETIATAALRLRSRDEETRAAGIEVLDSLLEGRQRQRVLAAFDEVPRSETARFDASASKGKVIETRLAWLLAPAQRGLPIWLRLCAWSVARSEPGLDPAWVAHTERELNDDPASRERLASMSTVFDRIAFLRRMPWFAGLRDDFLAEVARKLSEMSLAAGDTVFREAEAGTQMYFLRSGRVRVHRGERTVAILGAGDFFGEMAVVEDELRSASVTVLDDAEILCLTRADLMEAMAAESGIALGIIRSMSRRLRDLLQRQDQP